MDKPLVLGISASLRNSRFGAGSQSLIDEIKALNSKDELYLYLEKQANLCLDEFVKAGRKEGLPFNEIYRNLQKRKGEQGLSNSEIMLAAALWGAYSLGIDIGYVPLSQYLSSTGKLKNIEELKGIVQGASAFLVSTPVYFGDRSSPAQSFLDFIGKEELIAGKNIKVYGGLSVGAKRNGGQETTLIYQMLDFLQLGFAGVGNDSETTAQYGGTGHAGDVGTMAGDTYGLDTAVGTGKRIASISQIIGAGMRCRLKKPLNVSVWVLKDNEGKMERHIGELVDEGAFGDAVVRVHAFSDEHIEACIACDICPEVVGSDLEYRCVIKAKRDAICNRHDLFLEGDAIVVAALSTKEAQGLCSCYQRFVERTRYIRRGDFLLSNRVVAPFVIQEIGVSEYMDIRILTSMLRHHTVVTKPVVGQKYGDVILNRKEIIDDLKWFADIGEMITRGRLALSLESRGDLQYNPVGYVLSAQNNKENSTIGERRSALTIRHEMLKKDALSRVEFV